MNSFVVEEFYINYCKSFTIPKYQFLDFLEFTALALEVRW